jgi:hypothetical protein
MSSSNFDGFDDLNDEDRRLVAFLKQNKLIAPDPATNLEQRIMTEIGRQPISRVQPQQRQQSPWLKRLIFASGAIAAGFLAVWTVNRQFQPTISEVDRAQIEASLIKSWSASVGEDSINEDSDEISSSDLGLELHDTSQ